MIRAFLTIVLLGCILGIFISDEKMAWFVISWAVMMVLGFAMKVAEWFGLDERRASVRKTKEYFLDESREVVEVQVARAARLVGDTVELVGHQWTILEAGRDEDADLVYVVAPL